MVRELAELTGYVSVYLLWLQILTVAWVFCERRYDADRRIDSSAPFEIASQGGSATLSVTYKNTKDRR